MITLQLKRTELSIEENDKIKLLVLAKGEAFILVEPDRRLLFIGDGITNLIDFYTQGKYVQISKFISSDQILAIPESALPDGLATVEQLNELRDYINDKYDTLDGDLSVLDEKIDISKIYSVICHSLGADQNKKVQVDIPEFEDYTGLTLVIRFDHGNDVSNPVLFVNNVLDHNLVVAPLYIGPDPISGVYNWKDGDTLIFTYYDNKMNMAGTSASRVISNWCSENNATLIDGSKIYTGSITADKIAAGSITADQIAIGSLPASVLSDQFSAALNNLSFIERQAASSRQVICTCETPADQIIKEVYLNGEAALSVGIIDDAPMYGTVLVVRFTYGNESTEGCCLRLILDGFPFPSAQNNVPPIGYYDSDNVFHNLYINDADMDFNWNAGDVRVLVYDGSHWLIQPPSGYLRRAAEWCLQNDQTFIQGGSIVAGRISCAQLDAGFIDANRISLNYYSTEGDGNVILYGGFDHFNGSTGDEITKGVAMYGSSPDEFNIRITNRGMLLNIDGGRIDGWAKEWKINASSGIKIGNISDTSSSLYTSSITLGNNGGTGSTTTVNGKLKITNLPTSDPHSSGQIWSNNGVLTVSNG